jgi:hypothetical protein
MKESRPISSSQNFLLAYISYFSFAVITPVRLQLLSVMFAERLGEVESNLIPARIG